MIRLNYHLPGTPPATLLPRANANRGTATITLIQYDAESIYEGEFDSFEEMMERFDPAKVNWINIDGLHDIELLRKAAERFKIHPLALEDVLNTTQRPKVEPYDDNIFIVSEMAYFDSDRALVFEQVSIFLGEGYLLLGHQQFVDPSVQPPVGADIALAHGEDAVIHPQIGDEGAVIVALDAAPGFVGAMVDVRGHDDGGPVVGRKRRRRRGGASAGGSLRQRRRSGQQHRDQNLFHGLSPLVV